MSATKACIAARHPGPAIKSHEPKDRRISTSVREINITTRITSPCMHLCRRTTLSVTDGEHRLSGSSPATRLHVVSRVVSHLSSRARRFALALSRSSSRSSPIAPLAEEAIPKRGWCYRYLKWLSIASFLNYYSCSLFEASRHLT